MTERVRWPVVVGQAREIVNGYAPLKVTLRQVMYRLVSVGALPHTAPMYRRLSAQLAQARREGRFPELIDTVREVHVPPAWPDVGAFISEMPDWFRLDRTEGQEHTLYVAAETDTLRQQLTGWLSDLGILPRPVGRPRTTPEMVLADKACSSRAIRAHLRRRGIRAVIPPADEP